MQYGVSFETLEILLRLLAGAVLGGVIGLERDIHGRAAGLRTHLLVGLGASLFMVMSEIIAVSLGPGLAEDPGRIAAQIVTGIGFLGAGAIMKEGFTVRGLTTAACFWVVAAIGMASGAGEFVLALITTLMALVSLSILRYFEKFYIRESYRLLTLTLPLDVEVQTIIQAINRKHVSVIFVDFNRDYESKLNTIKLTLRLFHKKSTDKISREIIQSLDNLDIPFRKISWVHGKM